MRINNQPPVNSPDTPTPQVVRRDSSTANSASSPVAAPVSSSTLPVASAQDYSLVPSFELQSLTAVLAEIPPVRQDVVSETIRRLTAGNLQSRDALVQTAKAILGE
jgi:hypothetical protein